MKSEYVEKSQDDEAVDKLMLRAMGEINKKR